MIDSRQKYVVPGTANVTRCRVLPPSEYDPRIGESFMMIVINVFS